MKLTSSNFGAAIGISPFCSRQKLYRQLSGIENRDAMNSYMEWGLMNECNAVAAIEAHSGILFRDTGDRQKHYTVNGGEHEYGTTPDGAAVVNVDATPVRMGVEAKCPQNIWDEPPAYYLPQLIGQAHIADFHSILFGAWTPEETRIWLYVHCPTYWEWLYPLLENFMANLAEGQEPKRAKKPALPDINISRIL